MLIMRLATNDQLHLISKGVLTITFTKKRLYSQIALFQEPFVLNSLIALNNGDGTSRREQHDGSDHTFSANHDRVYGDQANCARYKQINGELMYPNFNKRSYRESGFASTLRSLQ